MTPAQRRAIAALPVTRDLPWRATRDPWHVLVAESCAQQTQAARAAVAWAALCERFPTPSACAAAPRAEVLRAWAGLGHYRRAVALHDAAGRIVALHGGAVPDDLEALLGLPGVGPYSARAVLAFAFERDVAVVDVNVSRVLSRAIAGRPLSAAVAQRLADDLVPAGRGWAHNQAMLDLGHGHCAASARCERCPMAAACRWRRGGGPDPSRSIPRVARSQPPFRGSDREGRGRLLAAVLRAPVARERLAAAAGWPGDPARALRVARAMAADGLVVERSGRWHPAEAGTAGRGGAADSLAAVAGGRVAAARR